MAKVTGPLMSMEASGSIGNALTFATWVGRQYVRQWVRPANPQTLNQMKIRNAFAMGGTIAAWAERSSQTVGATGSTAKELFAADAPTDQRWNGHMVRQLGKASAALYDSIFTDWDGMGGVDQDAWDLAAGSATPPFASVVKRKEGGVTDEVLSPGATMYFMAKTLASIGAIPAVVDGTPTTLT